MRYVFLSVLSLSLLTLLGLGAYGFFSFASYESTTLNRKITLTVEQGQSFQTIESKIRQHISSDFGMPWFSFYVRKDKIDQNIAVGMYDLKEGMTLSDILAVLKNKKVMQFPLTIVEGISLENALQQIDRLSYLRGALQYRPSSILPETYILSGLEDKNKVVKRFELALNEVLAIAWRGRKKNLPLRSKDELLVLASLIEKEAADDKERQIIAGVFINRLKKNMPLQTDPSVLYARNRLEGFSTRALSKKDLKIDSPYNTYLYKGLPPSPIALAGKKSIEAAAQPFDTDFLYFVADGKGKHRFAKTLKEHNQNVALYRSFYRNLQKEN